MNGKVYESISCHPDIYLFQLSPAAVICAPGLREDQIAPLRAGKVEIVKGENDPGGRYPDTARYNASRVGDKVFHNLKYTDKVILDKVREEGLKLVGISQGYSRCSILPVSSNAIITSDEVIAGAASREGVEVLLLSPGGVFLPGEEYGFIGGCGGILPDGTVVLLGDPKLHPQGKEIERFLDRHTSNYLFLKGLPLYDAGGLLAVGRGTSCGCPE
ncbi:MAG: hypothetical protein HQ594_07000 [Candidatus Omnitrophica bacterium]|nr:hypothetical protein [Candidatus Omnitrophota bacterium]